MQTSVLASSPCGMPWQLAASSYLLTAHSRLLCRKRRHRKPIMMKSIQDFIYGGPEQSEKERAKCSFTVDARMLLIALLTFMTYVMYHAQRITFSGVASSMKDEAGFSATKAGCHVHRIHVCLCHWPIRLWTICRLRAPEAGLGLWHALLRHAARH